MRICKSLSLEQALRFFLATIAVLIWRNYDSWRCNSRSITPLAMNFFLFRNQFVQRFFAVREMGRDRSTVCKANASWVTAIAIAAFAAALASQTAKAADQLPVDSAFQLSAAVAPHAQQPKGGRVSAALDSTFMSGGYQFKDPGADDRRSSTRSAHDGKTADPLASAINSSAGGSKAQFQKTPGLSTESGAGLPGAPRSASDFHFKKPPHWPSASR